MEMVGDSLTGNILNKINKKVTGSTKYKRNKYHIKVPQTANRHPLAIYLM
jgi:hypothetical protein